jgi:hypothetical protein
MYRTLPGRSTIANPIGPIRRGPITMGPGIMPNEGPQPMGAQPLLGSFKKGGKVKKTGNYRLHRGERVVKAGAKMKLKDLA